MKVLEKDESSGWALLGIIRVLIRERQREIRETHGGEGFVKTRVEVGVMLQISSSISLPVHKICMSNIPFFLLRRCQCLKRVSCESQPP